LSLLSFLKRAVLGHEVVYVSDIDPEMRDEDILEWAVMEQRIIMTTDNDFEQMIWQQRKRHCGVLRLENLPREARKLLLIDVLKLHSEDLLNGRIVIAMKNKFRIRQANFEEVIGGWVGEPLFLTSKSGLENNE
jgi:predicted nuclease of predicted toxin-antitoxin system